MHTTDRRTHGMASKTQTPARASHVPAEDYRAGPGKTGLHLQVAGASESIGNGVNDWPYADGCGSVVRSTVLAIAGAESSGAASYPG